MTAPSFISDGCTEKGLIKEVPRLHGPVRFEYRVMLSDKIRDILHSWDLVSATEKTRRIHAVVKSQVLSWDLTMPDQTTKEEIPLPVDSKYFPKLKRNIIERIFNIIMQLDVSDEVEEEIDLDKVLGTREEQEKN